MMFFTNTTAQHCDSSERTIV